MHVNATPQRTVRTRQTRFIGDSVVSHPQVRGYCVMYRRATTNHCPGCGGTSWHVGRITAECAYCLTALPIQQQHGFQGTGLFARGSERGFDGAEFAAA